MIEYGSINRAFTTASGYLLAKMDLFPIAAARGAGQVILVRQMRKIIRVPALTLRDLECLSPCVTIFQNHVQFYDGEH